MKPNGGCRYGFCGCDILKHYYADSFFGCKSLRPNGAAELHLCFRLVKVILTSKTTHLALCLVGRNSANRVTD